MLLQLELKNFKKHRHLVVDFTAGLNGIVGPNYTGKSTLLNGIMFCLGGSRMVPGKRLQNRDTNSGFGASLTWKQGGRMFHVERGKTTAHLYEAPEGTAWPSAPLEWSAVASGTSPVNNAIARLLGMPLKRFAQIKYARQKQAEALLRAGSTELFKIVSELRGLNKVSDALTELSADIGAQNKFLVGLEFVEPDALQAEIEALKVATMNSKTMEAAAAEIATHQAEAAAVWRRDAETASNRASSLRALNRKMSALQSELNQVQETKEATQLVLGTLRGEALTVDAINEMKAQRDAAITEKARLQGLAERLRVAAEAVQKVVVAPESDAAPLQAALDTANLKQDIGNESYIEGLEATRQEMAADIRSLNDQIEAVLKASKEGVCSACKRPFDGQHGPEHYAELMQPLVDKRTARQLDLEKAQAGLAEAKAAKKAIDDAQAALARLNTARSLQEERRAVRLKELEELSAGTPASLTDELASLSTKAAALETQLEAAESARRQLIRKESDLSSMTADEQRLIADLAGKQKELEAFEGKTPEALEAESEAATAKASECAELARCARIEAAQIREAYEADMASLSKLQGELAVVLDRNARFEQASLKLGRLTELQNYIRSSRDRLTAQVWEVFTASASMFVSSATGGRITEVTRSADGEFGFREDGFEMELAEASGAQSAIMGLAIQLALADSAPSPLDIILLDEPSADCDAEHSAAAMALLAASGRQVIAVTHREFDSALFNNTIQLGEGTHEAV